MDWAGMLAYITGTVDQELLARNEYLSAENRILKAQLNGRLKLSDAERATLGWRSDSTAGVSSKVFRIKDGLPNPMLRLLSTRG